MLRGSTLRPIIRNNVNRYVKSAFHSSVKLNVGSVFKMPAMSPTMTEGGIVAWKFKAGEEFSAGDVLLEVETDKATIDVEAQDDGIMWEVLENDGASGVAVGKPIALLAEPGDDLSSLEKPSLETESSQAAPKEAPKEEAKEQPKEQPKKQSEEQSKPKKSGSDGSSDGVFASANPSQKLMPSVELLLHQNNISADDAISKIPASGPNGRLLKGDVLAYIGQIKKESVASIAKFIRSREHLDLSNIKLAEPKPKDTGKPESIEPEKPSNVLTVEVTSEFSQDISKEKFQYAFEKSIKSAIKHTYAQRFPQYSSSPSASSLVESDLFDDLLAPPVTKNRFEVYGINYTFFGQVASPTSSAAIADEFDEILGLSSPSTAAHSASEDGMHSVNVEFKIKFDESLTDSKAFVDYFEDSLLSQIPSRKLKITN